MKKKGFTLVELLAVIAILAILVIIALPNVMGMFNQAKENSFATEIKTIFQQAEQQWITDSMMETGDRYYARQSTVSCGTSKKTIDLSGRQELNYAIKINQAGEIVEFYAEDGTYSYRHIGKLKINEINNSDIKAIAEDAKFAIKWTEIKKEDGNAPAAGSKSLKSVSCAADKTITTSVY